MKKSNGLTEVGRRLHAEHEATLVILNDLEAAILSRPAGKPMDVADGRDRENLQRFLTVVDRDVTRHFDFEERLLFPVLSEKGAADMADLLTQEHRIIKPIAHRLGAIAGHALQHGFNDATWREFRIQVIDLMERESFHIQKEEMGLVRALDVFLDPEHDRELARQYDET